MNPILTAIIWSMIPVSELRGGIPIAIAQGISPAFAFIICVLANMAVVPIVFFFLDYCHHMFMKINFYKNVFDRHLESARIKLEKHVGTKWEFLALMIFVGVPLPMTGAYTGTLLAWFFNIERKKAYLSLLFGVLIAGIIVMAVVLGGIKTFDFFIKN